MRRKGIQVISTHKYQIPAAEHYPMRKSFMIPQQLLETQIVAQNEFVDDAELVPIDAVKRVHDATFVDTFLANKLSSKAMQSIGFVWSEHLLQRVMRVTGATYQAAMHMFQPKQNEDHVPRAIAVLAGGAHHAHYDYGSGYCVFNDLVIAAEALCFAKHISHYLIIDLDVHQGDGTATLCANKPHAYTFSMHNESNFPTRKQKSSWDIGLKDKTEDAEYLELLRNALQSFRTRRRQLIDFDMVFYQAGVDVLKNDRYGRLGLSLEGVRERDRMVYEFCKEEDVPVVTTMGGGYASKKHALEMVVQAHVNTVEEMKKMFA